MKYFNIQIPRGEVHLYPLVCWHVGAKQSATKFIEEVIREIKEDPLAKWIYMGDAGECVTKASKGNIYEQLLNPGDQLRVATEYLKTIANKGLFGIRGNHGNRIDKETGVGWDEILCARVGVPYFGVSALGDIVLFPSKKDAVSISLYTHHGSASAIGPAGKMSAGHKAENFILSDLCLTAHTHACGECWPVKHYAYTDPSTKQLRWGTMRSFVCGSAYDSRSGYAEEKMYSPLLPEHLVVKIEAGKDGVEISHRKLEGFKEQYQSEEEKAKWQLNVE